MNGSWFLHPLTPSLSASLPPITLRHAIGPHTHSAHTQHTHRAHTHNTAHTPITLRHAFGPHTPITRTDHEHQSRTPRTQTPIAHSTHTRAPPYIHTYTHKHTHTHTHHAHHTHTKVVHVTYTRQHTHTHTQACTVACWFFLAKPRLCRRGKRCVGARDRKWTKSAPEVVAAGLQDTSEHRACYATPDLRKLDASMLRPGHVGSWH